MNRQEQEALVAHSLGVSDYVTDRGRGIRARLFRSTWADKDLQRDEKHMKVVDAILEGLSTLPEDFFDGVLGGWESVEDAASRLRNAGPVTNAEAAFEVAKTLLTRVTAYAQANPVRPRS